MMTERTALDDRRLIVPVAIREDVEARIQIPANLTEPEARKIAAVVMAYANPAQMKSGE